MNTSAPIGLLEMLTLPVVGRLGEAFDTMEEIDRGMEDLVDARIDVLTLGQYLRPSSKHLPVLKHYHPEEFQELKQVGEAKGIHHVEAGPLVRTSYHAREQVEELLSAASSPFPII